MSSSIENLSIGRSVPEVHDPHSAKALGFWIYLMSDAVIFALLFATYGSMVGREAGGPSGAEVFDFTNTALETAILLTSSLSCGIAVLAAKNRHTLGAIAGLLVTLLLGLGFVGLEIREFMDLIDHGAGPGRSGFLSAFFTLVGTHGLHVSFGMLWLLVMITQLSIKGPTDPVLSRLERWGAFWHFLDLVWIGIFSVVYLPGIL